MRAHLILLFFITLSLSKNDIGQFVFISDFHYDPWYINQTITSCQNPPTNPFGNYACDSSWWLVNETIATIANLASDSQFSLFGGDLIRHGVRDLPLSPNGTRDLIFNTIQTTFNALYGPSASLFVKSPIFTVGNNDLYPKYAPPPVDNQPDPWLASLSNLWSSINPKQYNNPYLGTFPTGGYYRVDPIKGSSFTVLILHTNYWGILNTHTINMTDPVGQFAWLQAQLASAKQENRYVYILGHIPPGIDHYSLNSAWHPQYQQSYLNIITPYLNTIIKGIFFGHEHYAMLRIAQSVSNPVFSYCHGSISPVYLNNPSFRIYTYNTTDFSILDWQIWAMDISKPFPWSYQVLYNSAVEAFGLPSITGKNLLAFVNNMFATNSQLFPFYYNAQGGNSSAIPTCNNSNNLQCKTNSLCDILYLDQAGFSQCAAQHPN